MCECMCVGGLPSGWGLPSRSEARKPQGHLNSRVSPSGSPLRAGLLGRAGLGPGWGGEAGSQGHTGQAGSCRTPALTPQDSEQPGTGRASLASPPGFQHIRGDRGRTEVGSLPGHPNSLKSCSMRTPCRLSRSSVPREPSCTVVSGSHPVEKYPEQLFMIPIREVSQKLRLNMEENASVPRDCPPELSHRTEFNKNQREAKLVRTMDV